MKNIILIFFFLLIGFKTIAQESPKISEENKIYSFVQKRAEPIEGMKVFYESFIEEFNMGVSASKEKEIKIMQKFVVEKDGTFGEISSESIDDNYRKEAIRVLKTVCLGTCST